MSGAFYALDYGVLFGRMARMGLSDDAWTELYHDIRALEAAALRTMRAAG